MFSSYFFLIWMMAVSKFLFNDVLYMFLFVSKLPRVKVNDVTTRRGSLLPAMVVQSSYATDTKGDCCKSLRTVTGLHGCQIVMFISQSSNYWRHSPVLLMWTSSIYWGSSALFWWRHIPAFGDVTIECLMTWQSCVWWRHIPAFDFLVSCLPCQCR